MKSKNYKSNRAREILEKLNNDRKQKESYCDITITAGSNDFAGHKCVLGVFSKFFSKMFSIDMKEKYEGKGKIQLLTEKTLEAVLNFIYTCDITVTSESVYNLIEAANFIGIPYLKEFCVDFLLEEVDFTNCLQIRAYSKFYNLQEVVEKADFVLANSFETLINENAFNELKFEDFKGILEMEKKQITSEESVYNGMIHWIKHDVGARRQHLTELFNLLKLDKLSGDFLQDVVSQEHLITTSKECLKKCFQSTVFRVRVQLNDQVVAEQHKANKCFLAFEANQVWKYDLETKQASNFANQAVNIARGSVVNHKDEIYVIRRNNVVEKLDLDSPNVLPTQTIFYHGVIQSSASVSFSNYIYRCGGFNSLNATWTQSAQRNDLDENRWEMIGDMNEKRSRFALVSFNDGIYAIGGFNNYYPLNTAECYNPLQDGWQMIPLMNVARQDLVAVALKGKLYAIGGYNNQNLKSVERFDPLQQTWCHVAEMNYARSYHGASVLNGKIYVTGGGSSIVEVYDPGKNIWTVEANITSFQNVHSVIGI